MRIIEKNYYQRKDKNKKEVIASYSDTQRCLRTYFFKSVQTNSIGFKSGDLGGDFIFG